MDNSIIFLGIVVFTIVLVYIGILLSGNTALVTTSTQPTTTTSTVYYTAPPPRHHCHANPYNNNKMCHTHSYSSGHIH